MNNAERNSDMTGLLCQVLHSLEYIHSKGYTHNDVKAANLLSHPDNPNHLYLVDFGLAVKYMKVPLISNNACRIGALQFPL